jgi:hypothetical protein
MLRTKEKHIKIIGSNKCFAKICKGPHMIKEKHSGPMSILGENMNDCLLEKVLHTLTLNE